MNWTDDNIAKAHRLGLSERQTPSRPVPRKYKTRASKPKSDAPRNYDGVPYVATPGIAGSIKLSELSSTTCRYPIGDPKLADFGFCGAAHQEGSPYCGEHHRITHGGMTWAPEQRRKQSQRMNDYHAKRRERVETFEDWLETSPAIAA